MLRFRDDKLLEMGKQEIENSNLLLNAKNGEALSPEKIVIVNPNEIT